MKRTSRRTSTLASIEAFKNLPKSVIARLDQACDWKTYPPDCAIVDYRERSTEVHFIVSGNVRVEIMALNGKTVAFRELGPGKMFGELAALDGKPRSARIETLQTCVVAQVSAQTFRELIRREQPFMNAVMLHLVGVVRSLTQKYFELSALGVCSRLHAELLRLAQDGEVSGSSALVRLPTHTELANRIGTNRETVTRELRRLQRDKLLARDGSGVVIDLERLDQLVRAVRGDEPET